MKTVIPVIFPPVAATATPATVTKTSATFKSAIESSVFFQLFQSLSLRVTGDSSLQKNSPSAMVQNVLLPIPVSVADTSQATVPDLSSLTKPSMLADGVLPASSRAVSVDLKKNSQKMITRTDTPVQLKMQIINAPSSMTNSGSNTSNTDSVTQIPVQYTQNSSQTSLTNTRLSSEGDTPFQFFLSAQDVLTLNRQLLSQTDNTVQFPVTLVHDQHVVQAKFHIPPPNQISGHTIFVSLLTGSEGLSDHPLSQRVTSSSTLITEISTQPQWSVSGQIAIDDDILSPDSAPIYPQNVNLEILRQANCVFDGRLSITPDGATGLSRLVFPDGPQNLYSENTEVGILTSLDAGNNFVTPSILEGLIPLNTVTNAIQPLVHFGTDAMTVKNLVITRDCSDQSAPTLVIVPADASAGIPTPGKMFGLSISTESGIRNQTSNVIQSDPAVKLSVEVESEIQVKSALSGKSDTYIDLMVSKDTKIPGNSSMRAGLISAVGPGIMAQSETQPMQPVTDQSDISVQWIIPTDQNIPFEPSVPFRSDILVNRWVASEPVIPVRSSGSSKTDLSEELLVSTKPLNLKNHEILDLPDKPHQRSLSQNVSSGSEIPTKGISRAGNNSKIASIESVVSDKVTTPSEIKGSIYQTFARADQVSGKSESVIVAVPVVSRTGIERNFSDPSSSAQSLSLSQSVSEAMFSSSDPVPGLTVYSQNTSVPAKQADQASRLVRASISSPLSLNVQPSGAVQLEKLMSHPVSDSISIYQKNNLAWGTIHPSDLSSHQSHVQPQIAHQPQTPIQTTIQVKPMGTTILQQDTISQLVVPDLNRGDGNPATIPLNTVDSGSASLQVSTKTADTVITMEVKALSPPSSSVTPQNLAVHEYIPSLPGGIAKQEKNAQPELGTEIRSGGFLKEAVNHSGLPDNVIKIAVAGHEIPVGEPSNGFSRLDTGQPAAPQQTQTNPFRSEPQSKSQNLAYLLQGTPYKEVFDRNSKTESTKPLRSERAESTVVMKEFREIRETGTGAIKRSTIDNGLNKETNQVLRSSDRNLPESSGLSTTLNPGLPGEPLWQKPMDQVETPSVPPAETNPGDQILQELKLSINHRQKEAVIHLKPESLGKVVVRLKMDGLEVEALFQVENEEVHNQLKKSMDQLVESLKKQNIILSKTEIEIMPSEKSSSFQSFGEQYSSGQEEKPQMDRQSSHQQNRRDMQEVWDDWEKHKKSRSFNYLA